MEAPVNTVNTNQDYYTSTGRKVGDFCLGFFGSLILNLLFSLGYTLINYTFNGYRGNISQSFYPLAFLGFGGSFYFVNLAILITLAVFAFIKKRRLIGTGIIIAILTPFILMALLLGACFLGIIKGGL